MPSVFDEQQTLQNENTPPTERNRHFSEYDLFLGCSRFVCDSLYNRISTRIDEGKDVVWVDLGAGNAVAQREAKIQLDMWGFDHTKLHTFAYDALPMDLTEINEWEERERAMGRNPTLLNEEYAPAFSIEDAATATFPEPPDIVTGVYLLQWVRDPLQIIVNAYNQSNEGAFLGFHQASRMKFSPRRRVKRFKGEVEESQLSHLENFADQFEDLPGFDVVYAKEALTFEKIDDTIDPKFKLYKRFPAKDPKSNQSPAGFWYVYTPK